MTRGQLARRKMVKQKQKWTTEEEEALSAGVKKHGHGKWKVILSDPQFASSLANRSNIDLKDKWRNMTVCGIGSSSRMSLPEPSSPVLFLECGTAEPSRSSVDKRAAPDYEAMILGALSSIEDPNGPDVNAILNFIEQRYELPQNFKRSVTSKLRRLVLTGELEKVDNCYKYKGEGAGAYSGAKTFRQEDAIPNNVIADISNEGQNAKENSTILIARETPEDAANVAAFVVAVAENLEEVAIKACDEADKIAELLEESMAMLQLAQELHAKCSRDGMVVLNP